MANIDVALLSVGERLDLLERIWESLSRDPRQIPLTASQAEELDQRLDALDREGPSGIPLDDALQAIRQRHA